MTIRILLADDHKIVFDSLKSLLNKQPDMQVVGGAENGRLAVEQVHELKPDVVIMDVTMPNLNGIDATRQIINQHPEIKVIALSMHSDKQFVTGILSAGASGYLTKNCSFDELVKAVRLVAANKKYLCPDVTAIVIEESLSGSSHAAASSLDLLSTREREIMQLLAEGKTIKQIAAHLFLSIKTIYTHRNQIMKKLQVKNMAELTKVALRGGLITEQD
jgi:DNA-binding NarL/FixJ family response regulator